MLVNKEYGAGNVGYAPWGESLPDVSHLPVKQQVAKLMDAMEEHLRKKNQRETKGREKGLLQRELDELDAKGKGEGGDEANATSWASFAAKQNSHILNHYGDH